MRKPRALTPGDRLAVVAPASPFPPDEFEAGLRELRRLGFDPVYDARVFERDGYLAGSPEVRAQAFLGAWRAPDVAGIVAARGGYGSVHLLPHLDPAELAATPKAFVGSSDVTTLLSFIGQRGGTVVMHGPMVAGQISRGEAGYDAASLMAALTGGAAGVLAAPRLESLVAGEADGPIAGGNLTQIAASLGTPYAFDPPAGCVLFLEDVGERPYRVDRLLTQLRLAGILARARALVFGEMLQCDEPDGSFRCRDVVHGLVRAFPGPVVYGLPAGHAAGPVLTLPLGVRARVVSGPASAVIVDEPAVE